MSDIEAPFVLDHVCVAVRNLEVARQMLGRVLGYVPRTDPVENTRQQVIVQFLRRAGSVDIKLIEPASPQSPLVDFIKRSGGGLHHLAFKTSSVEAGVEALVSRGARLIAPPEAGEAFDDNLIAFLFLGCGLNVELIDTDARRSEVVGGPP